MKQKPLKLIKRTVFVFRLASGLRGTSTDPTSSSVTIISTETLGTKL